MTTTVTLSNNGSATVTFTPVVSVNGVSTTLAQVTLAPGQTVSSAPITVPLTTTGATVTANVTAPSVPDSNPANNSDTELSGALFADVTTEVSLPASAPVGSVVSGTVVFTNSGAASATASAVVGTVTLSNGQTVTYTVGALTPGQSQTYNFTTTMPAVVLEATSTVATSTPESNTTNNLDVDNQAGGEATTPLFSDPGVNVQPIPSGTPGSTVTTTVTLSNNGSATVTFTPVVSVNGVSTTLAQVTLAPGQTVSSAPITVPLTTTGATVTANVTAPSVPDSNPANNSDTELSGALFADVTTEVSLPASAPVGSVVSGTVVFTNSGAASATASAVVGTVTLSNGQTVTYTVGALTPGQSQTYNFTTTMPAVVLEATSTVATSTPESNTTNNLDVDNQAGGEATTPLFSDPGVNVQPIPSGTPGSTVTTTVTLSNNGSATVTFTPVVSVNGVSTTLAQVTLAPGQTVSSAPITVPLTTTGATVTANVTAPSVPDSNPANNSDTEGGTGLFSDPGVDVQPIPSGTPGSTVTTTVTLSNNGSATVTFTPVVSVNGVSTTLAQVTLAPGQTVSSAPITVPLTTTGATVTANVTAPSVPDSNPANNSDTELSGALFADVTTEVSLPASAPVGSVVSGTVVFTNSGAASATASAVVGTVTLSNGQTVTYTVGALTPGQSQTYNFTTTMPAVVLEATSTVATSTPESNTTNNLDVDNQAGGEATTPLFSDPGVNVQPIPSGTPGSTVTTTVTLSNNGSATVTFTPVVSVNGVSTTLAQVTLAPGQTVSSAPITVPLTTTGATVTANVTAPSVPDSNPANNSDTEGGTGLFSDPGVDVQPIPSGTPGSTVTTTVTLSNNGSATVTFTPVVSVNGVSTTLAQVTLAPGQTVSSAPITVPLTTTGATVTANVTAPSVPDSNPANNSDTASVAALPTTASVSGRVYYDANRDGQFSGGEPALPGYLVELLRVSGTGTQVIGSVTTGPDGVYTIGNLVPGSGYQVRFRDPLGSIILGTPYNQATTTQNGQPSTGETVATTSPQAGTVSAVIQNITLYAGDNTREQNLPIDPQGVIYDSITRQPIGGVTVRLDGPTGFDATTHLLGGVNEVTTDPVSGLYQFLFINTPPPGVYTLSVTSVPNGYTNTTAVQGGVAPPQGTLLVPGGTVVSVQPQGTAPAVGVNGLPGTLYYTRFQYDFSSPGEVYNNHIPLDPISSALVTKVGDRNVAEVGDSLRYTIRITSGAVPASTVTVADMLPAGFRYIPGTARLGADAASAVALADPDGAATRSLRFNIGPMGVGESKVLTYFVRLGVGAQQGDGTNRATAIYTDALGRNTSSNTAAFKVTVQGGVFSNEGCIVGTVYSDCDGNHVQNNASGSRELGIPGVRLVMLDGTYVITDADGKYSVCGVKPQTHVIKVDRKTLPLGARMLPSSNRNAGDGNSVFVDMKGGDMARADFVEGSCSPQVLDQVKARRAQGGDALPETEKGPVHRIQPGGESPVQQIMPEPRQNGAQSTGGAAQ